MADDANTTPVVTEESTDPGDTEIDEIDFDDEETTESSSDESANSEQQGDESEPEQAGEQEEAEAEEPEQGTEAEDESPDEPKTNAEWAQRRIQQKQERERQLQEAEQTQQEYIQEAESDADRLVRTIEVERYRNTVKANESQILTEMERIKADPQLQVLNPDNKAEFNEGLYNLFQNSFEASHVSVDKFGNVIGVNASLYEKAKEWGKTFRGVAVANQAKGQKAARRNLSKAEPPSNTNSPQTRQSDPLMELWESDD